MSNNKRASSTKKCRCFEEDGEWIIYRECPVHKPKKHISTKKEKSNIIHRFINDTWIHSPEVRCQYCKPKKHTAPSKEKRFPSNKEGCGRHFLQDFCDCGKPKDKKVDSWEKEFNKKFGGWFTDYLNENLDRWSKKELKSFICQLLNSVREETIKECCNEVAQYSPLSAKHTRELLKILKDKI